VKATRVWPNGALYLLSYVGSLGSVPASTFRRRILFCSAAFRNSVPGRQLFDQPSRAYALLVGLVPKKRSIR